MEEFPLCESPLDFTWLSHEEIHREGRRRRHPDFERLVVLVAARHDDEDVHVAVRVRHPVGIGAEQDDLVRVETLSDLARKPADHTHGNIGAAIPAVRRIPQS
jgi:hypothetical protein